MADYIKTYTGLHMVPSEPKPEDFRIEDIAHALSLICRGNGHVKRFWSVGEHCIACAKEAAARGLSDRIVLACLLHDAGECYLSDVPRPVKNTLPEHRKTEGQLLSVVYRKYLGTDLTDEEAGIVKEIDDVLLWFDLTELLDEPQDSAEPELHIELSYKVRPFKEVEDEYLRLYDCYKNSKEGRKAAADRDKELLEKAAQLAREQFKGRTDKAGVDYFSGHLSSVAALVRTDREKTVAFLHDLLEDTDYPENMLREQFGDEIADAVVLLTHKDRLDEDRYLDYVRTLAGSGNQLAINVKKADLTNNSDPARLGAGSPEELAGKDRKRWLKYQEALEILNSNAGQ